MHDCRTLLVILDVHGMGLVSHQALELHGSVGCDSDGAGYRFVHAPAAGAPEPDVELDEDPEPRARPTARASEHFDVLELLDHDRDVRKVRQQCECLVLARICRESPGD